MSRVCQICGESRANEKFGGRGRRRSICQDCARLSKEELDVIERRIELDGMVGQSRLSEKNQARLKVLGGHPSENIVHLAGLILRLSEIAPGRRRRWKKLQEADPSLLAECVEAGLIEPPDPWD